MSTAQERILIFKDTMAWIEECGALSAAVKEAREGSMVYYEDDTPSFEGGALRPVAVSVSGQRSFEAAMELRQANPGAKIAVMNFANAFHPGGGVKTGASAQEECLCRCSTLYPVLTSQVFRDSYYKHHYDLGSHLATDSLIYTPGVVICKTDEDLPRRMEETQWVKVDVITVAAPDLRRDNLKPEELRRIHLSRGRHILGCAAAQGADILVAGAFGCGAFQNDPQVVAAAWKELLEEFPRVFDQIRFAVYCPPGGSRNYEIFKRVMEQKAR